MICKVKVIPKSRQSLVIGWEGDILKVKLRSVPEKGRANIELILLLADYFQVKKQQITVEIGTTSRLKRIKIEGL